MSVASRIKYAHLSPVITDRKGAEAQQHSIFGICFLPNSVKRSGTEVISYLSVREIVQSCKMCASAGTPVVKAATLVFCVRPRCAHESCATSCRHRSLTQNPDPATCLGPRHAGAPKAFDTSQDFYYKTATNAKD